MKTKIASTQTPLSISENKEKQFPRLMTAWGLVILVRDIDKNYAAGTVVHSTNEFYQVGLDMDIWTASDLVDFNEKIELYNS